MRGPPSRADAAVDQARAAELIERRFGLVGAVRLLGEGWDSVVFELDGTWAFKFPKRDDVVPHLRHELAVLPLLQHLPLRLPEPVWVAEADVAYPFPFVGYRKLEGVPADEVAELDAEVVIDQLAPFLAGLHAVPLAGPVADVRSWDLSELDTAGLPGAAREAAAWLRAHRRPAPDRVLLHGDLGLCHVLVDPATSQVTGILDWGDLDLSEAARDWIGVYKRWPEALSARIDRDELRRVAWWAVRFSLGSVVHGAPHTSREELEPALEVLASVLAGARRYT